MFLVAALTLSSPTPVAGQSPPDLDSLERVWQDRTIGAVERTKAWQELTIVNSDRAVLTELFTDYAGEFARDPDPERQANVLLSKGLLEAYCRKSPVNGTPFFEELVTLGERLKRPRFVAIGNAFLGS